MTAFSPTATHSSADNTVFEFPNQEAFCTATRIPSIGEEPPHPKTARNLLDGEPTAFFLYQTSERVLTIPCIPVFRES